MLVAVDHREELFAPGESLFGFDLGAKSRIRCSCIAFEHLDAHVSVGDCSGDGASGPAGDEPGEGAAKLRCDQLPWSTVDQRDAVGAAVFSAVVVDPGDKGVELDHRRPGRQGPALAPAQLVSPAPECVMREQ